jgi:RNA polymerase sigma factor (TIGR02999 family)
MSDPSPTKAVTVCLERMKAGDRTVVEDLFQLIYKDLRALAATFLKGSSVNTLQPTAIVHEAFLRLVQQDGTDWEGRKHFFDVAALAMRQLLTDYVRKKATAKRGGDQERVMLEQVASQFQSGADDEGQAIDLEALDASLTELEGLDPRQAQVVRLRFLTGLTAEETADIMEVSSRTVVREWKTARSWLYQSIKRRRHGAS